MSRGLRAGVVASVMALAGWGQLTACGSVPDASGNFTSVPLNANSAAVFIPSAPLQTPNAVVAPDQGLALVWSRNLNMCLGSSSFTIVAGAPVVQLTCDGSATQQWTWVNGGFRIGPWCMTATTVNGPIVFKACASGDGNQAVFHNYGKLVSKLGTPQPVSQADGTVQLISTAADSTEDPNLRVYLALSTPLTRGFVVRNMADSNRCLAMQTSKTVVLPCDATDMNQRWHFGTGFLRNLSTNLCLSHNTAAGPLTSTACANTNAQIDGFWLGGSSDLPGHATVSTGNFPLLVWDPNAADGNAVQFSSSGLPGRIWSMGKPAPY